MLAHDVAARPGVVARDGEVLRAERASKCLQPLPACRRPAAITKADVSLTRAHVRVQVNEKRVSEVLLHARKLLRDGQVIGAVIALDARGQ